MIILKADPEQDLYLDWSTVADGPGPRYSRKQLMQNLVEDADRGFQGSRTFEQIAALMERLDATGTSLYSGDYGFSSKGLLVQTDQGHRWLPRDKMYNWLADGDQSVLQAIDND